MSEKDELLAWSYAYEMYRHIDVITRTSCFGCVNQMKLGVRIVNHHIV